MLRNIWFCICAVHIYSTTGNEMKEVFSRTGGFFCSADPSVIQRGKKRTRKNLSPLPSFSLAPLLSGTVTVLQMLTGCQPPSICCCGHVKAQKLSTAGLYIHCDHKQNLQSQWDLSSPMVRLEEVLNALQPFAPAWALRDSGIIFDFWLPPTYRPQQRLLWKSVVAI